LKIVEDVPRKSYLDPMTLFNDIFLNFTRKIYENCPYIEYLTIILSPLKEHLTEFEKLLKICQNLKSLFLQIHNV
jgi:hypothetical protein